MLQKLRAYKKNIQYECFKSKLIGYLKKHLSLLKYFFYLICCSHYIVYTYVVVYQHFRKTYFCFLKFLNKKLSEI